MATTRSSLPLRFRQLLSEQGTGPFPYLKESETTPPKIKAFIDRVIKSPLCDIAIPLSGFHWEYSKGNFHHWRPLFLHFDTYFKTYLSSRKDLQLSDNIFDDNDPFPKHTVLLILRVMQTILENCHNKSSFGCQEHLKLLLTSTDPEVLIATLETLSALVKIIPSKLHVSGKLIGCGSMNSCLLSLAQGWGSKEEGLGLFSCIVANERRQEEGLSLFPSDVGNGYDKSQYQLGTTLHFGFHVNSSQGTEKNSGRGQSSEVRVIHIPDLHLRKEDDLTILKQCIDQYGVPPENWFSLLTRIRYTHSFLSPKRCRLYSRICLLAFIVLVQSNDAHEELASFFANEPEYTNDLIRLVQSEDAAPGSIRTLAMLALGAQLAAYSSSHERARILNGSSIISAGGNRMVLLDVLQKVVLSLNNSSDPSSLSFLDALLQFYLLHVISSSSSGGTVRGSGMVPTLLSLVQDVDCTHSDLLFSAVKTLQKLMDYSFAAVSLFKDLGGVELLAHRLQTEVNRVGTDSENSVSVTTENLSKVDDSMFNSQKRLIRAFLKALGSASYSSPNSTRSQNYYDNSLPYSLSLIFQNVDKFGGDIYFSAVTLMSEIIHKDPTCFSMLHELGLPDAFLSSVSSQILLSSKALTCIPCGLGAICLNSKGLEAVRKTHALRFLVETCTTRKCLLAMNRGVVPLSSAVEELLRHVPTLRSTGVDIIIEIIEKLSLLGKDICTGSSSNIEGGTEMETDPQYKDSSCHEDLLDGADPTADGVSNEQFVRLCIFHVMLLVRRVMENSENCRLFVEKKGIEALMKLLLQPSIVQSPEGMSVALHSTMVFKGFTQHHSTPLAHAFCSSLRDHLKKALSGFSSTGGLFSLGSRPPPDSSMFSPLFVVEFLLFLAASKETRWVSALLAEFGNGSKDVLEDIGRVHREVLWQIALLDDAKLELKDDICISCGGSQRLDPNANENDEQRFNFFRRFLDPLVRRRVSGRSVDSQFFDLVSMYHDVSRATGLQHSLGMDGPSSLQLGSGHQLQPSSSSDTGAVGRMEDDTQQSWYSSCCDMMRSLSLHISHLFLELGKVMLAPSHRRDDSLVVSPSAKSVVSTFASIACDHLSFARHLNPSSREAFISTKCRYLGKVVKFINSILMDRPESYNPLLLNCLYCHGVFQSILTTFEATSQLLFNVSRMSFSPMAIEDGNLARNMDGKIDDSWIYGSLACYGTLMDHLVTSSFIISPFTKHLLCQYITKGNVPVPRDAETFVKVLQSMVLKAVLPIWSHPHFPDCSYDFVTAIVSILRHIYSGVEVKNTNVNARAQMVGPPPDESAISRIVEMGFSRSRAEEALRQVRTNSVEMAMEWLVSHLEDAQEDDELARALAISLGSSGASIKEDEVANAVNPHQEVVVIQLPTDDELLLACIRLLQRKEPLVFPVRDLLVMICSQNDGCYRSKVVAFVIDQVKLCSSVSDCNETKLSAYFHVLALVLHEDSAARELAFQHGLVKISLDLLSHWDPVMHGEKTEVPKWVTTTFLAIDQMLQVDPKLSSEILAPEQLKKDNLTNKLAVVSDEKKTNSLLPTLGLKCCMDINEQKRLIVIACRCIRSKLPSETMHVVLQLCASLTKIHSIALTFLDAGGLPSLLNLPSSSLFSGFDNVSSAIVRHILEDPQTLQQAMEAEIRHTVVSALSRHSNGRLTPRIFLQNLAFVIARDPSVFMKAAQSVCQIQMAGERPHIVLLKDREKEKYREKDKDKQHVADGNDHGKLPDPSTKNVKVHRKPPQSFVSVIELLLDFVINFVPSPNDDGLVDGVYTNPSIAEMDVDGSENKGKGIAIADVSAESVGDNLEASTSLAKIVFILKLLSEILSTYTSSVHVLLRRDAEVNNCRGLPQRGPTANCNGGIIRHILHNLLPYAGRYKKDKKVDSDWRHKLSSRASQFLVTSSTRSTEGRRRVFAEISSILNDFVDSADGYRAPDYHIHAYVDLLNDILVARSPTGPFISAEASTTFLDVGLVRSLTRTLEVLDLDHADSPKIVTGIVKALELVTKEQIHSPDPSSAKGLISMGQTSDHGQPGGEDNGGNQLQSETTSQCNQNEVAPDHVEPSNAVQTHGSSDSITDDMEQEQDMNVCFPPETEDDSMHEASEEAGGTDNGVATVEIRFGIPHNVQDNSVDEDDGTSAEEEDEDEVDDEEENNDFEEDEVHHMSHPDTDQDENEIDEDEFDEDVVEDEDEDDEDDEDGVILRLEEGINGINVFDHIEVFGRENHFSNDTLHVMPVGVFGSRRHGRTTSIYSLLGRNGDSAASLQHPLLVEPSSLHPVSLRQSGDVIVTDGSLEDTSSRLDSGPAEEQQINRNTDMGSIDPAFLDALPEQLRVEVLSARQNQAAQPSTDPPQSVSDIDPEFLAALPPDIRAEVLAQQETQRLQQSQEFEGQPVEMDTVSIIATFPSDLREEVLLTSSDAILANLTPALVAEANMLRERFAHRYHNRTLLGMYPRNRRGESSRRGEAVRSSLDRATGAVGSHQSVGGKLAEADGVPLVDNGALRSMIRLLRVVQLPYKSQLQRLFLNLCAHPETRTSLVRILMDMLMLDILGPATESNGAVEPSYRLYGCQSSVTYSRPQFLDGVPPLVSRRILENLSYLAQNHPSVARLLLHLQLPRLPVHGAGQMRGKAVMAVEDDRTETKQQNGEFSIVLLLNLLNQPLYLRSVAHLEQLLTLLEVVINNAKSNSSLSNKSALSPPDQPSASQNAKTEASLNTGTVGTSALDVKSSKNGALNSENDTLPVLLSLPQTELRLLCSLLAREGLSENAYVLVAEVLKKLVAIAPTHCHLFITELADSVRSLTRSAMIELHGYGEGEKKLLSTATTDGTAILRVLQALSSLVSSLLEKQKEKNPHLLPDIDYNSALSRVWDINSELEPLWLELSACIIKIESFVDGAAGLPSSLRSLASTGNGVMPPLPVPPGTQNILPYIESFFVTCEKLCPGQSGATHDFSTANTSDVEDATVASDQNFPGSHAKADEKHVAFVKFSEKHRKLLNAFIRQNPGLLEKSLSLMLKVPRFIDFDNKRAHFRSKMKHQHDHHHNPLRISVRRAYILEDSYNQLRLRPEQDLKGRLTVHFQGEEGIDAGGLTREWYQSLSRVVFDKGALLFTTVGNESTFQPNPNSVYQTEHLSYFKFVGRVVGKALFDGQLLDVHFTRSFYKHILGVKVTYHDIEAIDPHYFKNLKWMLENNISDVLDLTFSIDADEEKLILYERAEVTDHELIPGGQNIKVTEENKHEYVNLVAEHRLTTSIRPQINAFMEGFNELIPRDLISIFNDKELELLISGLPDIDLEDMRANTEYSGYSAASPVIQWFWEVVQGFSKEDKARLLQFVTGTSKVPLEGFSALQGISGSQRFQIHKAYGSPRHLPSAHTCFNQLDLPEYPSKEQLRERLLLAIHEASEGFGFG
ncbi:hypothetical protein AAC387_Pa03g3392 [Persea americana]